MFELRHVPSMQYPGETASRSSRNLWVIEFIIIRDRLQGLKYRPQTCPSLSEWAFGVDGLITASYGLSAVLRSIFITTGTRVVANCE